MIPLGVRWRAGISPKGPDRRGPWPSMGSVDDCCDNAMIEAFWSRLQDELLNTRRWKTRVRARERDLRVHRDLPQPPTSPLEPWLRTDRTRAGQRTSGRLNPETQRQRTQ